MKTRQRNIMIINVLSCLKVMKHLSQYGVLIDYQHGFWVKRSTETQLICTIHDIGSAT